MVEPVDTDARGILSPAEGLQRFSLHRHAPSARVGRLVDRYWTVGWDLSAGDHFDQQVWPHPVTNVVLEGGTAVAGGVTTSLFARRLEGRGRAWGIMFRPAGFRPLLARSMRTLVDRQVPFADLVEGAEELARAVAATTDPRAVVALLDSFLDPHVPRDPHPAEATMQLAERIAADRGMVRVEQVAELAGVTPRTLQRRFADHVGITPKALIRRYRIFDAAEAARHQAVDWAALAVTLGYADQSHLVRDFRDAIGTTPAAYARTVRPAEGAP